MGYSRGDVRGLFISVSGFTESAISECKLALSQKTIVPSDISEVVRLLELEADLATLLKSKIHAALLERNPFLRYTG